MSAKHNFNKSQSKSRNLLNYSQNQQHLYAQNVLSNFLLVICQQKVRQSLSSREEAKCAKVRYILAICIVI